MMIKNLWLFSFFLLPLIGQGQVYEPQLSPLQELNQQVGKTNIKITYSRPSARGRTIFGHLVPYNEYWRTGANRNSKISFENDIEFNGANVAAGEYAIYTLPNKGKWEVILYDDLTKWEVPDSLEESKIVAQISVPSKKVQEYHETLEIGLINIRHSTVDFKIVWENTMIEVPIEIFTNKLMSDLIDEELKKNISDFHVAARYYAKNDLDLDQAKLWMEKAIDLRGKENLWDLREYAIIHYKLGDKPTAVRLMDKSMKMAKELKHELAISMNEVTLKSWVSID